ncbi:unnamed protein product [Urochloa humidicola]
MAPSAFILLLVPILASLATTGNASSSFDLRAELNHPYAGRPISKYEMIREAVRSSKVRRAWNAARACRRGGGSGGGGGGAISSPDVPVTRECVGALGGTYPCIYQTVRRSLRFG